VQILYAQGYKWKKVIPVDSIPGMDGERDKGEWWME
jgi:hypothetical protein